MTTKDIRWIQRFNNYKKALVHLHEAVELYNERVLTNIEKQGFIKAFEFTHELAWKVMKDYFQYQGLTNIIGSRDAVREAFQYQLISAGEEWMEMIKTRNIAVHIYDDSLVDNMIKKITETYFQLFIAFEKTMKKIADGPQF